MQHALRYVWSIPSARAEQKRIILSLNIPIWNEEEFLEKINN